MTMTNKKDNNNMLNSAPDSARRRSAGTAQMLDATAARLSDLHEKGTTNQPDSLITEPQTGWSVAVPSAPGQKLDYTGPTYYGYSPIKPSKYGALVWVYTYIAGLAGSAQILATIADLVHRPHLRGVVRNGRYLAMAAPTIGSALLIADLHTPKRWYNMLRIFRKTSPMSTGTYIFTGFGLTSGVTAMGQLLSHVRGLRWLRPVTRFAQIPAAAAGIGMSTYTGALLASTSAPLWAGAPRLLTARFACSAMATAAAALSLCEQFRGDRHNSKALDRLAMAATLADSALSIAEQKTYQAKGIADSYQGENKVAVEHKLSNVLEHALPLICYGLNEVMPKRSRSLSVAASLGVLAGGLLMRSTVFHAGNRSASRPQDYLAFTKPTAQSTDSRSIEV